MEGFKITRIYTDVNGDSRFEDKRIVLEDAGPIGFLSKAQQVSSIIFRKVVEDYDYNFHNAPARQYIILLDGEIEIETTLGEKRRFSAGNILLVEDITGKGHRTRNITKAQRSSVFVTLPET